MCRKSDRRNMEGLTIQLLEVLEAPGPASTSTGRFVSSPGTQDRGARHCSQQHFFVGSSTTRSTRFFLSFCVDLVGLVDFFLFFFFCSVCFEHFNCCLLLPSQFCQVKPSDYRFELAIIIVFQVANFQN